MARQLTEHTAFVQRPQRVNAKTVKLINELRAALKEEFGCDYAYTIVAKGNIAAASNGVVGMVEATENPSKDVQRS